MWRESLRSLVTVILTPLYRCCWLLIQGAQLINRFLKYIYMAKLLLSKTADESGILEGKIYTPTNVKVNRNSDRKWDISIFQLEVQPLVIWAHNHFDGTIQPRLSHLVVSTSEASIGDISVVVSIAKLLLRTSIYWVILRHSSIDRCWTVWGVWACYL